jgi:hypothetical protein
MENWGLITYKETLLLFQDGISDVSNKEQIVRVIIPPLSLTLSPSLSLSPPLSLPLSFSLSLPLSLSQISDLSNKELCW